MISLLSSSKVTTIDFFSTLFSYRKTIIWLTNIYLKQLPFNLNPLIATLTLLIVQSGTRLAVDFASVLPKLWNTILVNFANRRPNASIWRSVILPAADSGEDGHLGQAQSSLIWIICTWLQLRWLLSASSAVPLSTSWMCVWFGCL